MKDSFRWLQRKPLRAYREALLSTPGYSEDAAPSKAFCYILDMLDVPLQARR